MEETPLVSVVIPAFNAEKTLERALNSVLNQSWHELQVIVVDDGSRDGTLSLARRVAEKDPRVTVLTQQNAGVSAARNQALASCRGTYIRFVDADDSLPPGSVEQMVKRAQRDGAELVIGGYREFFGEKSREKNLAGREDTIFLPELLPTLNHHANSYFYGVLWNKLFLRSRIQQGGAQFDPGFPWGEDFAFVMDYLAETEKIAFVREAVYEYRRNPESASVLQVLDSLVHPLKNIRIKIQLYQHLKRLYLQAGAYSRYRRTLWLYLFRVGLG